MAELLEEQLDKALGDRETKKTLKDLGEADDRISPEEVRADVIGEQASVLKEIDTMLKGWRRAEKALGEAKRKLWGKVLRIKTGLAVLATLAAAVAAICLWGPSVLVAFPYTLIPWLTVVSRWRSEVALSVRQRTRNDTRDRFEAALRDQVTVAIRESVNRRLTSFSTTFQIFDQRGLRELSDPEREVSTTAGAELKALVASLDSGSVGLSGPRGVGKTTVMRSFTQGRSMPFNKQRIGLTVSAPVKYDPREFVLHLFALVCERVLGEERVDSLVSTSRRSFRKARLIVAARVLGTIAFVLIAAGTTILLTHKTSPQGPTEKGGLLLILGIVLGYAWFFLWISASPIAAAISAWLDRLFEGRKDRKPARTPEQTAEECLEQIRFQQSQASGASGSFGMLGLNLGGDSTTTLARTPWSLPEAVDEFRRFASTLSDRFVVIGIDEMDKMESDEEAREFLNNIKGIFGVTGCYYLVSVSEDAMSAFERRGLPFRDVFDSSFDAIQRVGYLTLAESRWVLESRVTGLPVPFQCLCHCIAGGLPRELIRVTRELVHQHAAPGSGDPDASAEQQPLESLEDLCKALIEAERRSKLFAATTASRSATGIQRERLVRWLDEQTRAPLRADRLRQWSLEFEGKRRLRRAAPDDENAARAAQIAVEMTMFNYYAATAIELFEGNRVVELLRVPGCPEQLGKRGVAVVERLACARQQFAISPWLAWETIDSVRSQIRVEPWGEPRHMRRARVQLKRA